MKFTDTMKFNLYIYFTSGLLFICFSFGIYLFLHNWNLDVFVKYLVASYLLAFIATFIIAFLKAKPNK